MSKRMTESQIVAVLKEAEAGMAIKDICRKHSIGNSTFYKWQSSKVRISMGMLCAQEEVRIPTGLKS